MSTAVKEEVIRLLDVRIIYPISDSSRVSLMQVIPKKRGINVVKNTKNKLIPTRTMMGQWVYIDYRIFNEAMLKDHFPLPFIDLMIKKSAGHKFYYSLDGMSGYFHISIVVDD